MAKILDGKKMAGAIKDELKIKIENWITEGHRVPTLHCIKVGEENANDIYLKSILTAAKYCGINAQIVNFKNDTTEAELTETIEQLNQNDEVDGILLLLPIPDTMSERKVSNAIASKKDVDGFNIINVGNLCLDMPSMVPATALAVVEILKRSGIETFGRDVVVVNRSKNIGMPISMILHTDKRHGSGLGMDATVTICHRYTPSDRLKFFCKNADIVITATGIPKLITKDMIKPGATVIDIGMPGDVDYGDVAEVAGAITPVPGGVGPMTVAMMMCNAFQTAQNSQIVKKSDFKKVSKT